MANSTFNGPIRSEGGFKQISLSNGVATDNFTIDSSGNVSGTGTMKMTGATNSVGVIESITAATKSVETSDSGTTYLLNRAAGIVVTLPTAAAGLNYTFIIGTTFTGTFSLDGASANDIYTASSNLLIWDKDAPGTVSAKQFYADGSDDDKMVMDADTKGRFIGGKIN